MKRQRNLELVLILGVAVCLGAALLAAVRHIDGLGPLAWQVRHSWFHSLGLLLGALFVAHIVFRFIRFGGSQVFMPLLLLVCGVSALVLFAFRDPLREAPLSVNNSIDSYSRLPQTHFGVDVDVSQRDREECVIPIIAPSRFAFFATWRLGERLTQSRNARYLVGLRSKTSLEIRALHLRLRKPGSPLFANSTPFSIGFVNAG